MSRTFVCSDHHFGQENLHKTSERWGEPMRPGFANATEWGNAYVELHNRIVPEKDSVVYFLGDLAINSTALQLWLPKLNGEHKILIMGNHDAKFPTYRLQFLFDKILGVKVIYWKERDENGKKGYMLSHIPVHPDYTTEYINIHGHLHKYEVDGDDYCNVCVDHTGQPIEIRIK